MLSNTYYPQIKTIQLTSGQQWRDIPGCSTGGMLEQYVSLLHLAAYPWLDKYHH